jgi:acyl-coenzyme A synthetase/AMP-(fatty) acid ligase
MVTELIGWSLELGLTRHTRFYIGRPIYYTGGLVLALATLLVAGTVVLNDYQSDDSAEEVWKDYQRALEEVSIDFAFFIPEQLREFLRFAAGQRPRTARTILTMGSPITGPEKEQVIRAFDCELVESWGNSESLGTITDPEDVHVRPDSIGRPFLTDEMCIVDEEFRLLRSNLSGRLAGSENAGFLRYSNRPDETNLAKRNELIISEDIGFQDEDGFFYIKGRAQYCVVLPDGSTVFLEDLE